DRSDEPRARTDISRPRANADGLGPDGGPPDHVRLHALQVLSVPARAATRQDGAAPIRRAQLRHDDDRHRCAYPRARDAAAPAEADQAAGGVPRALLTRPAAGCLDLAARNPGAGRNVLSRMNRAPQRGRTRALTTTMQATRIYLPRPPPAAHESARRVARPPAPQRAALRPRTAHRAERARYHRPVATRNSSAA